MLQFFFSLCTVIISQALTWLLSCLEEPLLSLCVGDGDVMVTTAAAATGLPSGHRFVWELHKDRQQNQTAFSLTFEGHSEDETK